jgi:spore germination protein GerM
LRRLAVLSLLPLAALAAGCALPTQGSPSAIPASRVPFGLLDPHPPATTTTKPSSFVSAKVYFLNGDANDALTPTDRLVGAPAQLPAIITALIAGPSSGESAAGLTTAIPSDVAVLSAAATPPGSSVVTVNFNTAFGQITGTATEQAVAQVVTTVVTEIGLGTGVVFEIDGTHTDVPIANGSLIAGPVYLLDVIS